MVKPSSTYKVNDVITFGKDTRTQIPTTHRIVKIEGEGPLRTFTTKGDANDSEDSQVTRLDEINGKVILTVPYLGYILDFAKKPIGFAILVGLPAVFIIFEEIMKIVNEVKLIRRKKNTDETTE